MCVCGGGGGGERENGGEEGKRTKQERQARDRQFSSAAHSISALGKTHMRPTPSLRSFPNVAFETVLTSV